MMTTNANNSTLLEFPMTSAEHSCRYRNNDDTLGDADTDDLMGEADAVLSVTPCKEDMDLSAYLVPDEKPLPSAARETPNSLETQESQVEEEDSKEVSDLLDYLNELSFESPRSLLEAHSNLKTPNPRAFMTLNRDARNTTVHTPANRKIFTDMSKQTWPAGQKSISRPSTPKKLAKSPAMDGTTTKATSSASLQDATSSRPMPLSNQLKDESKHDRSELVLDVSLEELLEETAEAMMSPRTTWQFSEEEWKRLEKVQEMTELLLREAEHERSAARKWAKNVHESVRAWVEEQRALQEAHADSLANDRTQLKLTQQALHRLQAEMETATSHHNIVKEKLKAVIQRQAETIKVLEGQLQGKQVNACQAAFKTPLRPSSTSNHTSSIATKISRISLSPTSVQKRDDRISDESPTSKIDPITPSKHDALPDSVPSPMSLNITPRTQRARTTLMDGGKLVVYRNGTEKETRPDGTCIIRFPNGDVKCTLATEKISGIVAYYHAKEKTTRIRHRIGVEIYEYPNGQVERNFPNGSKDVRFPDGTKRKMFADGSKETIFTDGICIKEDPNGKREITGKRTDQ